MNDLMLKIKHNLNVPILLCLNLIIAFYKYAGYTALNPAIPGGTYSMFLACILELFTSVLLFIYLVIIFSPTHRISYLIIDSLLVAIQLTILIEIALLYGILQFETFLVCSLAAITFIDRIFDLVVLGKTSRKKKQIIAMELSGSDSNV